MLPTFRIALLTLCLISLVFATNETHDLHPITGPANTRYRRPVHILFYRNNERTVVEPRTGTVLPEVEVVIQIDSGNMPNTPDKTIILFSKSPHMQVSILALLDGSQEDSPRYNSVFLPTNAPNQRMSLFAGLTSASNDAILNLNTGRGLLLDMIRRHPIEQPTSTKADKLETLLEMLSLESTFAVSRIQINYMLQASVRWSVAYGNFPTRRIPFIMYGQATRLFTCYDSRLQRLDIDEDPRLFAFAVDRWLNHPSSRIG